MRTIAYDEAHGGRWTVSPELARQLSRTAPEHHYFGHIADLAAELLDVRTVRITRPWDESTFSDVDAVVIADPTRAFGPLGVCTFSSDDIARLIDYVTAGGGVIVMTEGRPSQSGSNLDDLLAACGLRFVDVALAVGRSEAESHLLHRHFECTDVAEHHITVDVHAVAYRGGCAVACSGPAIPLVFAPTRDAVMAASDLGRGRVIAIGDSELFAIPHVSQSDNAQLFVNALDWASAQNGAARRRLPAVRPLVQKQVCRIRSFDETRDLAEIAGAHVIDMSPYSEDLRCLYAQADADPYESRERFLLTAELAWQELPRPVRARLIEFRSHSNDYGALLVRGLPVDPDLPPTPSTSRRCMGKTTYHSELWLAMLAAPFGQVFGYQQEKQGDLYQVLVPTPENANNLSSESSSTLLDFHTEVAFHPFLPDFLLLYCLRPDHGRVARTTIASIQMMLPHLTLGSRSVLFTEAFRTGIDYSFGSASGTQGNGPLLSVLFGDPYEPFMRFDKDLMVGIGPEARRALVEMEVAANACQRWVRLDAGDLLVIDNRRAVHGRSMFRARYDGADRWLQRVFVASDLSRSAAVRHRDARVIDVQFST